MKRFAKTLILAVMLLAMPLKQWAQQPYRQYADDGILLNFQEIDNVDFRVFLLYNLGQDNRFVLTANDEPGQFSISSNEEVNITNLYEAFETFYNNTYTDFGLLSKTDISNLISNWKECITPIYFASIMTDIALRDGRPTNNHCVDSDPFCTSDVITFAAATSSQTADQLEGTTLQDGCIGSSYSPAWYHMRIQTGGQFIIHAEGHDPNNSNTTRDIDFCIWGPYSDPTSPCVAQLTTNKIIDCCFSASYSENIYLGYPGGQHNHGSSSHGTITEHTPTAGEYYILMITNYSQQPCTISFSKTPGSGPGETDCGILPGIVTNDGPYCVGETIHLSVNAQDGATYSWTGPNGYNSNQQNPTRPNCTLNMAGIYTCTTTVGTQTTSDTTNVVIYPMPTANFNFTSACLGDPTQFTNTSTTNPSGQQIDSYQWNFGDGQTSNQQNPSHQYASAGTYTVTLTVSTGGHCTSTKTQTVTVYAQPAANAGPDQTIAYGSSAQLSGTGGAGTFNFHWDPANMVTNPNSQNTQTVTLTQDQTYILTVTNPQGGCSSTDEVTIYISGSAMTVTAGPDISICQGGSGQIYVSAGGGTGNLTYSWTPTTGLSNPNIYNPIASPSQTTTYTCHVTDGQTSQNVSVTVTVNDVIVENESMTICPDDVYHWHGEAYSEVGTYQFDTVTDQGCEKTIYLHLDHYPSYDETIIEEAICFGETYTFYGNTYDYSIQTSYTDHTIHGCDSIVRLNLTVYPNNGVTDHPVTVCESQLPFYYEEDPNQIPLYAGDHLFHLQDSHGCDSIVVVKLSVSNYYKPPTQTEFVCYDDEPSFYWDVNGQTYHTSGLHVDTIPYSDCEGIFSLDLNFQQTPDRIVLDTVVCDEFIWQVTGLPYGQTDTYYHSVSLSPYPCYQEYQLNLIVNKKDLNGEPERPEDFDKQCDSIQFEWFGNTTYFKENGDYLFSSINPNAFIFNPDAHTQTVPGCDTATMVKVTNMKYTPLIDKYGPSDGTTSWFGLPEEEPNDPTNDTAMCAAVVTNTEFFSFQYQFYVEDVGKSVWDTCIWTIDKLSWHIDPAFSDDRKSSTCWVYVADREEDLVVLTATARNSCGEKTKKFYLKSSFLDVDENELVPVNVDIVPNPNNGQMHLNFENMQGRTAVKVFDMTGNQIDAFETTISSNRYNYDYNMKKYADGIYFFVIANNSRVLTKKVVVIH